MTPGRVPRIIKSRVSHAEYRYDPVDGFESRLNADAPWRRYADNAIVCYLIDAGNIWSLKDQPYEVAPHA